MYGILIKKVRFSNRKGENKHKMKAFNDIKMLMYFRFFFFTICIDEIVCW